jgi:pilus assembly protein Flp/PilA
MEVTAMLAYFRRIATKQVEGDEGASAVEYGLLVAAIAAINNLVVYALGTIVKGAFKDTCDNFNAAGSVNRAGAAAGQSCNS